MAKINKLYTVILTNYNDTEYMEEALSSIFCQKYNNIQLIITDDASENFNIIKIQKFINKNKKKNIKKVDYIVNKKNLGTVKTLNLALKKAMGEYILFFASDDRLVDEHVLNNFSKAFMKRKINVVTSQWIICNAKMEKLTNYINPIVAKSYNRNIHKQYERLCRSNIYGAGSTSYRKEIFDKYNFDYEKYKLLEDWPFWLKLVSNNEKIYYMNFDGLYHRSGGISDNEVYKKKKQIFCQDILNTYVYEILPNLYRFNIHEKIAILKSYKFHYEHYSSEKEKDKYVSYLNEILQKSKILHVCWKIDKIMPHTIEKIKILLKYNIVVPITFIISLIANFFIINNISNDKNILLFGYIIAYMLIYLVVTANSIVIMALIRRKRSGKIYSNHNTL